MNVLFLTTHLNTGGITSYLLTLTKGLREEGVGVHIASGGGDMRREFQDAGAQLRDVNIRTKSELAPRIYFALPSLMRYIDRQKIDLVHAQTRITQVMGFWLSRFTGRPWISTCHGFFKPRLSRRLFPCWGNAVIAISAAVERHLRDDFHVSPERIMLVPTGIDMTRYTPVRPELKEQMRLQYNLGQEGPVIGIIARLSDVKGHDILIEAMRTVVKHFPDVRLLVAGDGKMEATLREMVGTFHLEANVFFYSSRYKSTEILPLLDLFVMPSRQEGLGISIMEAQAAGLPVIASRVGGIPGLIDDGKTGFLVDPENPKALAEKIVAALGDRHRLQEIGECARAFIRAHYSAQAMVEQTLRLYRQMSV